MQDSRKKNATRQRRTRAEWMQLIERFDAGNQDPTDFCRTEGIGIASFAQWRRKLKDEVTPNPRFVEIKQSPVITNHSWHVELVLGDDVVLRLSRA